MSLVVPDLVWKEYCNLYAKFTPSFQKDLLQRASNYSKGSVIDAGVGVGKMFSYYDVNGLVKSVVGIDSSFEMLDIARKFKSQRGLDITLEQEDVTKYNFYGNADTIVSLNVLYALKDPIAYLHKLSSQMEQNSSLILSSQNRDLDLKKVQRALEEEFESDVEFERFKEMQSILSMNSQTSTRRYALEEILSLFEVLNMEIIEIDNSLYLGSNFLVVGRKK